MSSARMQDLFEAAKNDGPSAESRAAMWTGIETASLSLGAGSAGGTSALGAAKAAIVSSKLVLGLVLGATLTVGVAGAMIAFGLTSNVTNVSPGSRIMGAHVATPRVLDVAPSSAERHVNGAQQSEPNVITGRVAPSEPIELANTVTPATVSTGATRTGTTTLSEHDRLAREARMVSEARGALHRGEPEVALRIVRSARTQPGARLVPEELTVEAQALRAMGDEAGAKRAEADLAGKFPEHSLSH